MEKVERRKRRTISPVWILPLVAIAIGSWLIFKTIHDAGIDIEVSFDDAAGLMAGKTQVIF